MPDVQAIPAGEITIAKTGPGATPGEDTFLISCGTWSVTATREQLSQIDSRIRSQFGTPPPRPGSSKKQNS